MMLKESIVILGANGGRGINANTTCIKVNDNIVIDAGNIISSLGEDSLYIDHIFLTHSHLDHIIDIPFMIDLHFEKKEKTLTIYGLKKTLEQINKHIFNWNIWPDFSEIDLLMNKTKAVKFEEITPNNSYSFEANHVYVFEDVKIKPILTNHTVESCGYVITKNSNSILFTSDTYTCDNIWREINTNKSISSIIIDVSFPSRFTKLANDSKHLTPALLEEELKKLERDDVTVHINHLKPAYKEETIKDILQRNLLRNGGRILKDGDVVEF